MKERVTCDGRIEIQFRYIETGDKGSRTIKDREEMINMFLEDAGEALEDSGLIIQEINMLDFDYTATDISDISEKNEHV